MSMKKILAASSLVVLATLNACGGDDADTAKDPASDGSSTAGPSTTDSSGSATSPDSHPSSTGSTGSTGSTSGSAKPGRYPSFDAEDYTYVLDTICYCPLLGPTRIKVEDGEVSSAVAVRGGRGIKAGSQAPDQRRLTINDIIDKANDPQVDDVRVDWPDDQDWPNRVQIDQLKRAIDDEITYVIKKVEID